MMPSLVYHFVAVLMNISRPALTSDQTTNIVDLLCKYVFLFNFHSLHPVSVLPTSISVPAHQVLVMESPSPMHMPLHIYEHVTLALTRCSCRLLTVLTRS
jgi:hypothetical protein